MELRDFTQNPDPVTLHNFLTKNYPNATYKVGYEAGFCGVDIQRQLEKLQINCVVWNAADIPKSDKDKRQKNDKRHARAISEEIKNNNKAGIHIPQAAMEYARSLVRQRQRLVLDSTRQKCRIRLPQLTEAKFINKSRWFANS